MKRSSKLLVVIMVLVLMALTVVTLTACPGRNYHTVTFVDGTRTMFTMSIRNGETLPAPGQNGAIGDNIPTREGDYNFIGWFGTPDFGHAFDFATPITDDRTIFAQFQLGAFEADEREWAIVGSGLASLLAISGWGSVITPAHLLTNESTETENRFEIELDLRAGDYFQIATDVNFTYQRGWGSVYLAGTAVDDFYFRAGPAGFLNLPLQVRNIIVRNAGRYRLTLLTNPANDTVDPDGRNINHFDRIEVYRIGDPTEALPEFARNYYITGRYITENAHFDSRTFFVAQHRMNMLQRNALYTKSVWLPLGEEFMFMGRQAPIADPTNFTVGFYMGHPILCDDAEGVIPTAHDNNIRTTTAGLFTFTLTIDIENPTNNLLEVTVDADALQPQLDFYIDGQFDDNDWDFMIVDGSLNADARFERVGETNIHTFTVELEEGDIFSISAFPRGLTDVSVNWMGLRVSEHDYRNLLPHLLFGATEDSEGDFTIFVEDGGAGKWIISINQLSGFMRIVNYYAEQDRVWLHGNFDGSGWPSHNWRVDRELIPQTANPHLLQIEKMMDVGIQFGFQRFAADALTGSGDWRNWANVIERASIIDYVSNEINATGGNITISTSGHFRIIYNLNTSEVIMTRIGDYVPVNGPIERDYVVRIHGTINGWSNDRTITEWHFVATANENIMRFERFMAAGVEFGVQRLDAENLATQIEWRNWSRVANASDLDGYAEAVSLTNLNIRILQAGVWRVDYNLETGMLTLTLIEPYIPDIPDYRMWIAGTFNTWSHNQDAWEFSYEAGVFVIEQTFVVGDYFMMRKFDFDDDRSGDWWERATSIGWPNVINQAQLAGYLVARGATNIEVLRTGLFRFEFDIADGELTIEFMGATRMWAAGTMNSWSHNQDEWEFEVDITNPHLLVLEQTFAALTDFMLRRFPAPVDWGIARGWPNVTNQATLADYMAAQGATNIRVLVAGEFRIVYNIRNSEITITRLGDYTPDPSDADYRMWVAGTLNDWSHNQDAWEFEQCEDYEYLLVLEQFFVVGDYFMMRKFEYDDDGEGNWWERAISRGWTNIVNYTTLDGLLIQRGGTGHNIEVVTTGFYRIVYNLENSQLTITFLGSIRKWVAGSMNAWSHNQDAWEFDFCTDYGYLLVLEQTFNVGDYFMMRIFACDDGGEGNWWERAMSRGWPHIINYTDLDGLLIQRGGTGNNIEVVTVGTFRITYNIRTSEISITQVV